jgi:hypothetical protein
VVFLTCMLAKIKANSPYRNFFEHNPFVGWLSRAESPLCCFFCLLLRVSLSLVHVRLFVCGPILLLFAILSESSYELHPSDVASPMG